LLAIIIIIIINTPKKRMSIVSRRSQVHLRMEQGDEGGGSWTIGTAQCLFGHTRTLLHVHFQHPLGRLYQDFLLFSI
jgi:hypothetical protein